MKSIRFTLVFMGFLMSCDFSVRSDSPDNQYCYHYYMATLLVKYENGNPCTIAYARSDDMEFFCEADNNGIMKIYKEISCDEENSNTIKWLFNVYIGAVQNFNFKVWQAEVELIKNDEHHEEWPEPIEINLTYNPE